MPQQTRQTFSPEFKREAVRLLEQGDKPASKIKWVKALLRETTLHANLLFSGFLHCPKPPFISSRSPSHLILPRSLRISCCWLRLTRMLHERADKVTVSIISSRSDSMASGFDCFLCSGQGFSIFQTHLPQPPLFVIVPGQHSDRVMTSSGVARPGGRYLDAGRYCSTGCECAGCCG